MERALLCINAPAGLASVIRQRRRPAWSTCRSAIRPRAQAEATGTAWEECSSQVIELGFGGSEADLFLRKAHGWSFQGYWRNEKEDEVPDPEKVASRIAYLRELGLSDEALASVLKAFPEALGLDLETRMKPNVAFLQRTYRLEGEKLVATIVRKPNVLGNNLDCAGDCVGECNRCWVRF